MASIVFGAAAIAIGSAGHAQSRAVTPPCGVPPVPFYAALGAPPAVLVGPGTGLPASLDLASCVHWDARDMSLIVLLAGRFRDPGGAEDILARFGAISRRAKMPYWSIADKKFEPMVTAAAAVTGPDGETHRGDFTVDELADGAPHYFVQEDDRSTGEVIYTLQMRQIGANHLELTVENLSPVKNYFIRLFDPGDLRTTFYLDQLSPGIWGFYSLSGIQETEATGDHRNADANRAIAEFTHIATMTR